VPVADTIRGFKEIVEGKHDKLSEQDLPRRRHREAVAKFQQRKNGVSRGRSSLRCRPRFSS
jgi:F0F1-type ATP synthase beta subunit